MGVDEDMIGRVKVGLGRWGVEDVEGIVDRGLVLIFVRGHYQKWRGDPVTKSISRLGSRAATQLQI